MRRGGLAGSDGHATIPVGGQKCALLVLRARSLLETEFGSRL
jgi:hypothetical protein